MSNVALAFGVGYIFLGLVCVGLAIPLIRGRVRPNHWYGIRIPAAFVSDEAWYRINRHGGRSVAFFGAALGVAGATIAIFAPAHPGRGVYLLMLFLPLILLVPMIIHIYRYPRA